MTQLGIVPSFGWPCPPIQLKLGNQTNAKKFLNINCHSVAAQHLNHVPFSYERMGTRHISTRVHTHRLQMKFEWTKETASLHKQQRLTRYVLCMPATCSELHIRKYKTTKKVALFEKTHRAFLFALMLNVKPHLCAPPVCLRQHNCLHLLAAYILGRKPVLFESGMSKMRVHTHTHTFDTFDTIDSIAN